MDEKTKTPEVIKEQTSEQADLSLFGLIMEADFFVQFIMFLLLLSSVWCWTIIINKSRLFRKEKRISNAKKTLERAMEVLEEKGLDENMNLEDFVKKLDLNLSVEEYVAHISITQKCRSTNNYRTRCNSRVALDK